MPDTAKMQKVAIRALCEHNHVNETSFVFRRNSVVEESDVYGNIKSDMITMFDDLLGLALDIASFSGTYSYGL